LEWGKDCRGRQQGSGLNSNCVCNRCNITLGMETNGEERVREKEVFSPVPDSSSGVKGKLELIRTKVFSGGWREGDESH